MNTENDKQNLSATIKIDSNYMKQNLFEWKAAAHFKIFQKLAKIDI